MMKQSIFSMLCIFLFVLFSCSKDKEEEPVVTTFSITSSVEKYQFPANGGEINIKIIAEGASWKISNLSECSILKFTPEKGGEGESQVEISVPKNETNSERKWNVKFTLNNNVDSLVVAIEQEKVEKIYSAQTDSLVLVDIYTALNGEEWKSAGGPREASVDRRYYPWDLTKPMSTWRGVRLAEVSGSLRVMGLVLDAVSGTKGTLPESIGDLVELNNLTIDGMTQVSGSIPKSIINLTKCDTLSINKGALMEWKIPDNINNLKELKFLCLSGGITFEMEEFSKLYSLTSLEELYVNTAMLMGAMPDGIGSLSNLKVLNLNGIKNMTSLPEDLTSLSKLEEFYIAYCEKINSLPSDIGSLTNLRIFHAKGSSFTSLPESFNSLKKLEIVKMSSMQIQGNIDKLFNGMSNMVLLHLDGNQFTGTLEWLTSMKNLKELLLSGNQIGGELRIEDMLTPNIEVLMLSGNSVEGTLKGIGNLKELHTIDVSSCKLTGEIPAELGDLNLLTCFLNDNNLTGNLSDKLASIIKNIFPKPMVSGNRLSGTLLEAIIEAYGLPNNSANICPQQEGYGFINCDN